jgi:triosephosphate isomerase (TIM)
VHNHVGNSPIFLRPESVPLLIFPAASLHYRRLPVRGQQGILKERHMKKLIAGNWKMNGSTDSARALVAGIINALAREPVSERCEVLVCPPVLHIPAVRHAIYGFPALAFGAQDCSAFENGDVSAAMIKDSGCSYVILGHSERRTLMGETSETVARKAARALEADLKPIICVGETEGQRESGAQNDVVRAQIEASLPALGAFDEIVLAYEPVWAIGTGKTATPDDIEEMHGVIRALLKERAPSQAKARILYGGSVKPDNATAILACANVDGALVGGASLKPEDFVAIARAV